MKKTLQRIMAIAVKEWIQILRDTRSLILALVAPAILILLFGYALTMDVKNVPMVIYDQDRSQLSKSFIANFTGTSYFNIVEYCDNYTRTEELIDRSKAVMAIIIPPDFSSDFYSGRTAEIQTLVDGTDSTSSTVSLTYLKIITAQFNTANSTLQQKISILQPINIETRLAYNETVTSRNFIVPGLIIVILSIISALITSLSFSKEWERGTMETLITTPVREYELMIGKLIPYLFLGIVDVMITVFIGYFLFDVPMRGSFMELYLLALLFLIGTSSLGMLISSATRAQVLSIQFAMFATFLPAVILSGFIFPIENMPFIIQGITYLLSARYMMVISKSIMLKGIGGTFLTLQIIFLSVYALVIFSAAVHKIKLRIPEE